MTSNLTRWLSRFCSTEGLIRTGFYSRARGTAPALVNPVQEGRRGYQMKDCKGVLLLRKHAELDLRFTFNWVPCISIC